jgi:carboxylesterase type B
VVKLPRKDKTNYKMPLTTIKNVVKEVPGKGFQKRVLIHDAQGNRICQRLTIPYAEPITSSRRFQKAIPITKVQYGTENEPTDCTRLAFECPQSSGAASKLTFNEDCLQMNIWIPEGNQPSSGWPVFFYIHGGFLQWGSPNEEDPVSLYLHTNYPAIFVSFTYRLTAFGFLASKELVAEGSTGNNGFWDQRLALEFVANEISSYGGDPKNITVGGLSAGAYSTFHQLAYSLSLPADRAHIRRVVMWSNGCGLQPKPISEVQSHFDALCTALNIPMSLTGKEKIARLRATPWKELAQATDRIPINAFRAVTDGHFVRRSLFAEIHSGLFAQKLKERGIQILAGDVKDEFNSYRKVQPPTSYDSLIKRLAVEYPENASERLARIYCPNKQLPPGYTTWQDIFGRIYADIQVHVTQRGLISSLVPILPADQILRYRIEKRAKCIDKVMPPGMGVCHGSDFAFWFWGHCFGIRSDLNSHEARLARGLLEPLGKYIRDEDAGWGTETTDELRRIDEVGKRVEVTKDPLWNDSLKVWNQLHGVLKSRL